MRIQSVPGPPLHAPPTLNHLPPLSLMSDHSRSAMLEASSLGNRTRSSPPAVHARTANRRASSYCVSSSHAISEPSTEERPRESDHPSTHFAGDTAAAAETTWFIVVARTRHVVREAHGSTRARERFPRTPASCWNSHTRRQVLTECSGSSGSRAEDRRPPETGAASLPARNHLDAFMLIPLRRRTRSRPLRTSDLLGALPEHREVHPQDGKVAQRRTSLLPQGGGSASGLVRLLRRAARNVRIAAVRSCTSSPVACTVSAANCRFCGTG